MSTHKEFTALCTNLGVVPGNMVRLHVRGVEVQFWANIGSKGALLGVIFSVALGDARPLPASIVLRRENALDRFGKATQINRELQIGDVAFDRAVYIESDLPDGALEAFLRNGATREAVLGVLAAVDATITLYPPAADARTTIQLNVPAAKLGNWQAIRAALDPFVALQGMLVHGARELIDPSGHDPYGRARAPIVDFGPPRKARAARGAAFGIGLIAIGVLWVSGTPPTTLGNGATFAGLGVGALVWATTIALLILAFRGRSTSLRTVILFGLGYLALVPFFAISVMPRLNALADSGPSTPHDTVAIQKFGSKNTTWLDVGVPWHPGAPHVSVPLAFARGPIPRNDWPVRVTTRPGAFGWEWISDVAGR